MLPDIIGFDAAAPFFAAAFLAGYLIGGAPFGILIARAFGLGDPREHGSGNIGANNVLRSGNKLAALLTLALDAAKGGVPTLIVWTFMGPLAAACAGLGAFLGHCFSPYLRFGGGKGVATGFGVILAWRWEIGLLCVAIWLAVAVLTRISSAASLATAVGALGLFIYFKEFDYAPFVAVMAAVVVLRHHENILRLLKGREPRISFGARERQR